MRAASVDGIFISYRRDDSAGYAGRLYDRLAGHFGAGRVFMDVEGIEPGTDFVDAIENAVASCRVLIVLIGDEWLSTTDANGRRRLDDPHDFIRLETRAALARDIRVVPVLLDRAPMPAYEALPEDLRPLVRRQAVELNHKQWDATSGELIRTLEKILGANDAPTPAPSADPEPAAPPPIIPAPPAATPTSPAKHWGRWGALAALIVAAVGAWLWLNRGTPHPPATPASAPPAAEAPARNAPAAEAPPPVAHLVAEHKEARFDAIALGKTATLELKLRNTGQAPAALKSTLTDNAHGSFRIIVDTCGDSLRAGGSCSYTVAFSPAQAGNYLAALHVSQLEGEPLQWQLSGEAEAPPAPTPSAPVAVPTPAPAPAPQPPPAPAAPRILSLDARAESDGATICYRVENSTQLRLTPRPGDLPSTARNCIKVPLSAPATLTLTATGPGGSTRQKVLATPTPPPPAPVVSAHPQPGETWIYRTRGKWPTSPARTLQFTTDRVDGNTVYENMSVLAPKPARAVLRRSPGTQATLVDWGDIGWEFSPWMGAFDPPTNSGRWRSISTPKLEGRWGDWNTVAKVDGRERVRVPAGSFDTVRIEVWSTRLATGGSAMRDIEPTTVHFDVWYAPEAKRYVKMVRTTKAASNAEIEEDIFELVEIRAR
ncbi:TIR domain-containing protein [Denitromonas ohlonensis]|uniref:TIR domain-containing protein n=1 Tax=Denitromonas ohlonensis TaxID=3078508 RepID=UPI001C8FA808|nr:TIR domain-containing protein [Denitromonas ohlonensis]